jgi:hypothetical protein
MSLAMTMLFAAALAQKPGAPPLASGDVIVLRSGEAKKGQLKSCDPDSCVLGARVYRRDVMSWVGLAVAEATPPMVTYNSEDEVHLRDGSVFRGHLIGVSLGEVDIEGGSYDRDRVAWIHLVRPPNAPPPPKGAIPGTEVTPSPPPPPQPPPPPVPTPQPQPQLPPPPPAPKTRGERGHLWSGEMHVHLRMTMKEGGYTDQKSDVAVHLREFRSPLFRPADGKRVGTFIDLEPEGSEYRSKYETDVSGQYAGTHCDGSGMATITAQPGEAGYGHASAIWIDSGSPRYVLSVHPRPSEKFVANCRSWSVDAGGRKEYESTQDQSFYFAVIGKNLLTPCSGPACDPNVRTIEGESGRMFGSFHNVWDDGDFHHDLQVRWSLCRDDVPCQSAPPEPEANPCGGTAQQDALLQTCRDQERDIARKLNAKWAEYQHTLSEAAPHKSEFSKAMLACTAWDATQLALEALVLGDVPSIGATGHIAEEAKEAKEALELINALMKASTTGDPLDALKQGDVAKLITAAESIKQFLELYNLLDKGNAEAFVEKLDECNAPLSDSTLKNAKGYVLDMERSFEELEEYHKIANDLRSKDDECLQKQWDAYAACVQNARCNHTAESACAGKKPPGNWPEIP